MNQELLTELDKILPVVARVHGENHPELAEVLSCYNELKVAPSAELFAKLRELSKNYEVPGDACPTYEKTYKDLAALDAEFTR